MTMLEDCFFTDDVPHHRKIFVLSGIGGIGKTQLCLHFALKHKDEYSACVWIDGSSIDTVKQSFRQFAAKLSETFEAFAGAEEQQSDDVIVQRVLAWLSINNNRHWLLVVDNVDLDYDLPYPDSQAYDVEDFIPRVDHGSIIVTTRLRSLESLGSSNKVQGLDSNEARKLLEAKAGRSLEGSYSTREFSKLP